MMRTTTGAANRTARARVSAAAILLAALAAGCYATDPAKVNATKGGTCALLGPSICAELVPAGPDNDNLRYVAPNTPWTQYTKIMVDPVTFWAGDDTSISPADQQMLTNYFYQALQKQLGTKFQVVTQPGPGVMRLQVAMTDASAATPVLRTVSMIVPQAHALETLEHLATGSFSFVGAAQAEGKLTDSVTGRLLGASVSRRVGGGSVVTAAQWQWGDAENACNAFAQRLTNTLYAWTSGKTSPS